MTSGFGCLRGVFVVNPNAVEVRPSNGSGSCVYSILTPLDNCHRNLQKVLPAIGWDQVLIISQQLCEMK
jgi:hypothetical protein